MTTNSKQPTILDRPTKTEPRLPPNTTLLKRPILHPPIPSSSSKKSQQVVYVSSKTPFVSAVKRVRKLLAKQEPKITLDEVSDQYRDARSKGNRGKYRRGRGRGGSRANLPIRGQTTAGEKGKWNNTDNRNKEGVLIKATGKAIDGALNLALYFQGQKDVKISIRTGTVDVIDDYFMQHKLKETSEDENDQIGDKAFSGRSTALPSSLPISDSLTPQNATTSKKRKSAELDDDPSSLQAPTAHNVVDSEPHSLAASHETLKFYPETRRNKKLKPQALNNDAPESIPMDIEETIAPSPHDPSDISGLDVSTASAVPSSREIEREKCTDMPMEGMERDCGTEVGKELPEDQDEPQDQYSKIRKLSFVEIGISLVKRN